MTTTGTPTDPTTGTEARPSEVWPTEARASATGQDAPGGSAMPYSGEEHEARVDPAFLAAANAADAELVGLVKQVNKAKALQSGLLERIALAQYYRPLGFSSVRAYAVDRGVEPTDRKARELCTLEAHLERLPDLRAAFLAGERDGA